jgi:hypothetical protein
MLDERIRVGRAGIAKAVQEVLVGKDRSTRWLGS